MTSGDAMRDLARTYPSSGHHEATAVDLVHAVERACPYPGADGPTDGEMLAALALLPTARLDLERAELCIIDRAREAGVTWDRIGRTLRYGDETGDGAAQGAQRRATILRARVMGRPVAGDAGDEPVPETAADEPGEVVTC